MARQATQGHLAGRAPRALARRAVEAALEGSTWSNTTPHVRGGARDVQAEAPDFERLRRWRRGGAVFACIIDIPHFRSHRWRGDDPVRFLGLVRRDDGW